MSGVSKVYKGMNGLCIELKFSQVRVEVKLLI